ncbi:hypothetical protein BDV95DRAFT_599170 [Massariosphaeria phaeospora]|uniref:Uncharacterized protein n=1 Tax=Massariosphaeria phaeospora TaxID=100035 RepID=A0A7C8M359_9PLEO|nr:hypothetical protein BDV95DRAFT_599170 [Massariosphaeria phaeospora]
MSFQSDSAVSTTSTTSNTSYTSEGIRIIDDPYFIIPRTFLIEAEVTPEKIEELRTKPKVLQMLRPKRLHHIPYPVTYEFASARPVQRPMYLGITFTSRETRPKGKKVKRLPGKFEPVREVDIAKDVVHALLEGLREPRVVGDSPYTDGYLHIEEVVMSGKPEDQAYHSIPEWHSFLHKHQRKLAVPERMESGSGVNCNIGSYKSELSNLSESTQIEDIGQQVKLVVSNGMFEIV